jgi:hypothetical protein
VHPHRTAVRAVFLSRCGLQVLRCAQQTASAASSRDPLDPFDPTSTGNTPGPDLSSALGFRPLLPTLRPTLFLPLALALTLAPAPANRQATHLCICLCLLPQRQPISLSASAAARNERRIRSAVP